MISTFVPFFLITIPFIAFTTFHLLNLIWNLVTMPLWYIFAFLFGIVATLLPRVWNTARYQPHLVSIVANSFLNRSALFSINIFLHLLGLRSLFQFANLFLFVMTILLFNWNGRSFS